MRALTKKQKSLITKLFKQSGKKQPWDSTTFSPKSANDLTWKQFEMLEEINNTEVLYQNITRFINDLYSKELIKMGWQD